MDFAIGMLLGSASMFVGAFLGAALAVGARNNGDDAE